MRRLKQKEKDRALLDAVLLDDRTTAARLLAADADVHARDAGGGTALSMARDYGFLRIMEFLRERGAA